MGFIMPTARRSNAQSAASEGLPVTAICDAFLTGARIEVNHEQGRRLDSRVHPGIEDQQYAYRVLNEDGEELFLVEDELIDS